MLYLSNSYLVACVYFSGIQDRTICLVDRNQILFDVYIFRSYCSFNQHAVWKLTVVLPFLFYLSHLTDNNTKMQMILFIDYS